MSALGRGIPRAFVDHRTGSGRAYSEFCRGIAAKFGGTIPVDARPLVKVLGRLAVDMDRVHAELEKALARRRMTAARRLRRQLAGMNTDMLRFTERIDAIAEQQPREWQVR